jgi:surface polysaccharide O-acyltransferase-like enzyme
MVDRRFVEIDILKVAGIATVILIHCVRSELFDPLISPFEVWVGYVTRFGVPAFLFASGFLYAGDPRPSWRGTGKRLRRIVFPYLVASLAAQAWWAAKGISTETGSLWLDLLFGSSMGPFYYVFVITILVAFTPLFARLPAWLLAVSCLVALGTQWYVDVIGTQLIMFFQFRSPFLWWAYFLIGWLVRLRHAQIERLALAHRLPAALVLAAAIAVLSTVSGSGGSQETVRTAAWLNIYAILAALYLAGAGRRQSPPALRFLSDATYGIFLLHLFFVTAVAPHFPPAPLRAELIPIAIPWLAGAAGSLATIVALRRLLGKRSRDWIGA